MTTERPIIMSAHSIPRIFVGAKTQTRRILKPVPPSQVAVGKLSGASRWRPYQPNDTENRWVAAGSVWAVRELMAQEPRWRCSYGIVGDRLWVRETWRPEELESGFDGIRFKADEGFVQIANTREAADAWVYVNCLPGRKDRWRPSIYMPRWASRITLEVTAVRVEQLHEITDADALAEGMVEDEHMGPREQFLILWDQLNAKRGFEWDSNPRVTVTTFKLVGVRSPIP